jgi:hypothetical protein
MDEPKASQSQPSGQGGLPPHEQEQELAAKIHALMTAANTLFHQKHYRLAKAASQELARLDPKAFMPEQIIEACDRELRRRRAVYLAVLAAMGLSGLLLWGAWAVIARFRISCQPPAGTLRLKEGESLRFAVTSVFKRQKNMEFTWELLGPDGKAITGPESAFLSRETATPWICTYSPSFRVATARPGDDPAVRTLSVRAESAEGRVVASFRWTLRVANVPRPPVITAAEPPAGRTVSVVAGERQAFRLLATDGDGGAELTYQWFVDNRPQPDAAEAAWTYVHGTRDEGRGSRGGMGHLDPSAPVPLPPPDPRPPTPDPGPVERHTVTCRVANRFGEPFAQIAEWAVEVVRPRPVIPEE